MDEDSKTKTTAGRDDPPTSARGTGEEQEMLDRDWNRLGGLPDANPMLGDAPKK